MEERVMTTTRVAISAVLTMAICLTLSSGCAQSYFKSAAQSIENNDYESAVNYLELGAQNGDRRCAYLLGLILLIGDRVDRDLVEGERWMREAADAELPVAQVFLGTLYATGEGVEKDPTLAAEWYRRAAEYGNPLGQAALGAAEFYGVGVPADTVEGYVWTRLAAEQGFPKAISNLSEMSDALTEDELKQAERRVARFHPKKNEGGESDFSDSRENRAFTSVRKAGHLRGQARAFGTAAGDY
jgi:TPR repeat protein